jgi:4-aminobutyrate aminotransferase-like enzyme
MPDAYRGRYRGDSPEVARLYADHVRSRIDEVGGSIAAFIFESMLGCGGQIILPPGYLRLALENARKAGAVCIADEVQIGFGRVGDHFWAFESEQILPDIVTLGKPIGNGHPMGAVITTREIADAFDNGMEYFNTFGGNPVSCAIGKAVLDVLEEEELQAHARDVGSFLLHELAELKDSYPLIGDVRGRGLFLGVELVSDRTQRTPATRHADYVVNRMRDRGVLLSTDGPDHNVIKIKPPLVFSRSDAERLITTLNETLEEDCLQLADSTSKP